MGWGVDTSEVKCYFKGGQNDGQHGCESLSQAQCGNNPKCEWGGYPFWIMQNSWGENYGEGGYIRVGPMGSNPWQLEAMATVADPVAVHKTKEDTSEKNVQVVELNGAALGDAKGENAITEADKIDG